MTKTVIEMARETGARPQQNKNCDVEYLMSAQSLERFAELVRMQEREACAKISEDDDHIVDGRTYYDQLGDANATARNIAAAIRARSNT